MQPLVILGLGDSAHYIADAALAQGWQCIGTQRASSVDDARIPRRQCDLANGLVDTRLFDDIASADALLCSWPPAAQPASNAHWQRVSDAIAKAKQLRWMGYLSSTGVYAGGDGRVVDQTSPADGRDATALTRLAAEARWHALAKANGASLAVFRLAGIYGRGRNALQQLAQGSARYIHAPGVLFNRIHVEDIARAVLASMLAPPSAAATYVLADDEPAEPAQVLRYAAHISGLPLPAPLALNDPALSDGLRRFYQGSKRVDARSSWAALGTRPRYANYRDGLDALWAAGQGQSRAAGSHAQP